MKKDITDKHENGVCVSDLAARFSKEKLIVCTIIKQKEEFSGRQLPIQAIPSLHFSFLATVYLNH